MSHTYEIWTTFCSNFLKRKNGIYKYCRSWWAKQTWYSKLFNLKSFRVHSTRVKVHLTKFDLVKLAQMRHYMTSDEKTLNTKFDHLQDLQLLHSLFSHLRNFYQTLVTNSWISYTLSKTMSHACEIWTTFCSNFLKWKNCLYKDCIYWWA